MYRPGAATLLLAAVILAACGGGDATSPPGEQKWVGVSLAQGSVAVVAGATGTVGVTVTRGGGYAGSVSFQVEGVPTGVTVTFSPHPVPGAAASSTMTIAVASAATAGRYLMTVQAQGAGVEEGGSAQIWLDIQSPPDYTLRAAKDTISVLQGASGQLDVNVSRASGFAGEVSLSAEGLPAGVTGTFSPNPATADRSTLGLSVGAAVASGRYTITVRGAAAGMPARSTIFVLEVLASAQPGFTLDLAPASLSVVSGGSAVTGTVNIRRTGGFAGAVTLVVQGQPTGVTATVAPAGPVTDSLATISFTAALALVGGTYAVKIVGTATGYPTREATLQLTVQEVPGFWLTLSTNAISSANGAAPQTVTIQITRTGGFSDTVHLSMTGLPAGVTATFSPAATTGGSSVSIAVSGAAAGSYTATLHATAIGQVERTTRLTITVLASSADIAWRFCAPNPSPVFFAFQDGVSPYVVVSPAGDGSYTTGVASGRGAVAFVVPGLPDTATGRALPISRVPAAPLRISGATASGYTTYMYYGTTADLQAVARTMCASGTRTVRGSVAGVPATDAWSLGFGGASITRTPGAASTFTLSNVLSGPRDLIVVRATPGAQTLANAFVLRRDVDAADGSTLPTIDFASESFAPASGTLTVNGIPGLAPTEVTLGFVTANGSSVLIGQLDSVTSGARTVAGVPAARLRAGDLHSIESSSEANGYVLGAKLFANRVGAWNISLPGPPQTPGADVYAFTPYVRMRARGSFGLQGGAFGGMVHATFIQPTAERATVVYQSRNYVGATGSFELRTGGYNTLAGWSEASYGFQAGAATSWTVEVLTAGYSFTPADGSVLHMLRTSGHVTP